MDQHDIELCAHLGGDINDKSPEELEKELTRVLKEHVIARGGPREDLDAMGECLVLVRASFECFVWGLEGYGGWLGRAGGGHSRDGWWGRGTFPECKRTRLYGASGVPPSRTQGAEGAVGTGRAQEPQLSHWHPGATGCARQAAWAHGCV